MSEILITCPECGSITSSGRHSPKCYANPDKGVYYCFHCQASGSLDKISTADIIIHDVVEKAEFNPAVWERLEPLQGQAMAYAIKRLGPDAPSFLRYDMAKNAIAIPCRDLTGQLCGIKYRFLSENSKLRYISEPGSKIGEFLIPGTHEDRILVVEGEFDALTAYALGFKGPVLALQTTSIKDHVLDFLAGFRTVFLCLDRDNPGQEAQNALVGSLGALKTIVVSLPKPFKDLNEAYMGLTDHSELLHQFKTPIEKVTVSLRDRKGPVAEYLKNKELIKGFSTGYPSLDRILAGGLRKKELTVLNGFFKRGKTTFTTNLTYNMMKLGVKCAISSFEMDTDTQLLPNYLSLSLGTDIAKLDSDDIEAAITVVIDKDPEIETNLAVFNTAGRTTRAEVEAWLRHTASLGFELIILDHSGFMLEDPGNAGENEKLAELLSSLCKQLDIHIIVVVQSPKPSKDKSGGYIMELSGLTAHGGTAWAKQCSNFLALKVDFESKITSLTLKEAGRNRWTIRDEEVWLHYDRETGRLSE